MPHPLSCIQASAHQPSRMLKFNLPLMAALMPEVPLASNGAMGLLSHTSTPDTKPAGELQIVVLEKDNVAQELRRGHELAHFAQHLLAGSSAG